MGIYIGRIEKISIERGVFFNFEPIAEVQNNQAIPLNDLAQKELLPESERRNICFAYNFNNKQELQRMNDFFSEDSLILFDFTLSDLDANFKQNSTDRNSTGYKVSAMKMLDAGKILPIGNLNVYFAVHKSEIISDFMNDTIVDLHTPYVLLAGNSVFVEMDDFWAGPYEVKHRDYDDTYYIQPQIKENKYTISGYKSDRIEQCPLRYSEDYWGTPQQQCVILCPKQDAVTEQLDVISDYALIESFKDIVIAEDGTESGFVKLDDIPAWLEQYEKSAIMDPDLPDKIRHSRLERLSSIMLAEKDIDNTLRIITNSVCDLLVKYQDSPNVNEWLQTLIEKNPRLLNKLEKSQYITKQLIELEKKRNDLTKQIEESSQRAESIDQQANEAIEAKKREMLEKETEYSSLSARIEESKKTLNIIEDLSILQQKHEKLQSDVYFLDRKKTELDQQAKGLEVKILKLIDDQQEKMVEIAFNGFMASKMLRAAAEWESEQYGNEHTELINKIQSVPMQTKSSDELIEYLCRVIQKRRPNYSKNTIINIAICMTQGFLTVFSGDPGCGKTSICNIMGEALGLNKIADFVDCSEDSKESVRRYIAVSVERGWTSKRDFVGYYNPLSKTFDKSNRRIYDALHQLDTEKRLGALNLPYVILLDEANLSPMEHYWADFMNICDDLSPHSRVNLGENHVFSIPETLRFVATINNDHTTETLSPRLIDRAWVITLPQLTMRDYSSSVKQTNIPADENDELELISWPSLKNAFISAKNEYSFTPDIQKCYDSIISKLREKRFSVSPRIDIAIKQYWATASNYFKNDDTQTAPATIALDYAVAQRILPKIIGNGEDFEKWLNEFISLCSSNGLNMSAKILKDIVERGNQQMKYYQFFG